MTHGTSAPKQTAYINARIYTVDPSNPWAEALLVTDGRLAVVGTEDMVREAANDSAEYVDLQNRMVMPGIHDAHLHLLFSGLKFKYEARISPGAGPREIVRDLKTCGCPGARDGDGNEWLVGGEYIPMAMGGGNVNRDFLDEAFPDQPVFLYDYSIHHGLANSRALELAGVRDETPDPFGGHFVREEGSGALTGEMVEQARWPVLRSLPEYPASETQDAVAWAIGMCHRYGITSVQEASASPRALRAFSALDRDGRLKLHLAAHLIWREEGFGMASAAELDQLIEERDTWASAHVDTRFIKIWLDGAPLPPHLTDARLNDDGSVDESKILIPRDDLRSALLKFDAAGLSVKIHCAGEGAIREALDAIEHVRKENGGSGPTHELAHAGFISAPDYPRIAGLNVVAEMSPAIWHIPEYGLQDGFRFRSVLGHGADMTIGSDWILTENPNLFPGLQGMLQHGEESVDLETALRAVTISGARAVGRSQSQGSLEAGKSADFIVLDRILFDIPTDEIGETRVLRTVFEGETVYMDDSGD